MSPSNPYCNQDQDYSHSKQLLDICFSIPQAKFGGTAHAPWRTQMPRKLTAAEIAVQQHVDEDLLKKHNAAAKLYGNLGHLSRSQEGV